MGKDQAEAGGPGQRTQRASPSESALQLFEQLDQRLLADPDESPPRPVVVQHHEERRARRGCSSWPRARSGGGRPGRTSGPTIALDTIMQTASNPSTVAGTLNPIRPGIEGPEEMSITALAAGTSSIVRASSLSAFHALLDSGPQIREGDAHGRLRCGPARIRPGRSARSNRSSTQLRVAAQRGSNPGLRRLFQRGGAREEGRRSRWHWLRRPPSLCL